MALTESTIPLDAHSLEPVLIARIKRENLIKYAMDLIWLPLKAKGGDDFTMPRPSELYQKKKAKPLTAQQIIDNTLTKLGGRKWR